MNPTASPGQEHAQLREAVRRNPADFIAWLMLADAEMGVGALEAAGHALQRAQALRGDHPETLARRGRLHWMRAEHAAAVTLLRHAAALMPQHPGIALWLGHALEDAGDAEPAAQAYAIAHRLMPDAPGIAAQALNWQRRLCDWTQLDALSRQVRQAVAQGQPGVEPFAFLSEDSSAAEQLACARLRAAPLARLRPLAPTQVRREGPLRLGFLSNGFGAHPTGLLTVAMFEALRAHPQVQAQLFALNRDDGSEIRRRLAAAAPLHDVAGQPHQAIAHSLRGAGIDLLFDLRGWGGGGAPEVLALRPAPVQINWLAYPGTSGAPWIDYVIGDAFALPDALAPHYSETVLRLPRAFQPSDTTRIVEEPPPRSACGLPEDGVVFCCFNNSYKLNPRSFGRLMAVLRGVPGSVLWLLSGPGHADARLRAAAGREGIDPRRLVFMPKLPHPAYLARYRHADLFLDTHPYNAHTTASDALWAGCPVLTTPGQTFAARVAGSLNHHLGLDALNLADDAGFVAHAVALGNTPARLSALRGELAARRAASSLFDMAGFARDFAALAGDIGRRHGWHG
ncbi:UDP-N-acetylglucosamine-peptide N-acetylglucosaminyltransferase [Stenotrophomonas sp. HITSZ_GD]|uniref:O-linked N-acetylglucosamine transferase, SPINDLY family protein n=1 Tax=Stenotrophomonas sp. HITSZ_GD TaxID=3037248 RepID=UPI00240E3D8B|nr:UDP-N-acetylglucosamine-peptide N-acetylglucosaminyltransferase [Stenotrophomonas sp. HITSZ_GD]MDG2526384.1 UDP-N-acetylglucosamine-peptide N-acetylglucosaminyltransferase [Stenotrophomonas sp. HITSZ_GD]